MNLKALRHGALGCVLASAALSAQVPPSQGPTAQPGTSGQRPTFVVNADLVTTDVIPRDARGQFVADLSKDDFEVLEDGVRQNVISMLMIHGGRAFNQLAPPPPTPREGIILPQARPTSDAAGRIFVLFIDDLHLGFRNTGYVRDLINKISKTLIHEGDLFAVQSTGPTSIAIDLTYDRKRLDEVAKRIMGGGLRPKEIIEGPVGSEGPNEVRYRANVAFSTAYDLVNALEKVRDRRKSLIYISEGYDFNPFEKTRYGTDSLSKAWGSDVASRSSTDTSGTGDAASTSNVDPSEYDDPWKKTGEWADADLAAQLSDLTRAATRANVAFYTIDPRGLASGMPDLDEDLDPMDWQDYLRKSIDSLRVLAEQTGGIAVVSQNDFTKALSRIDSETSDYYVLGYYSSNPDPLRRTREITVNVKRPDVSVQSRRYYTLKRQTPIR
jgi:VWFA-related protein